MRGDRGGGSANVVAVFVREAVNGDAADDRQANHRHCERREHKYAPWRKLRVKCFHTANSPNQVTLVYSLRGVPMPEEISAFSRVDAATDSRSLVDFLDRTAAAHFGEINRRSIELLRLHEDARVLDVGCGTGDDVRAMRAAVGPQGCATGVDLSQQMIDEALLRDRASKLPSRFVVGDARDLPFEDGSFEACRISRVLLHVADAESALKEV